MFFFIMIVFLLSDFLVLVFFYIGVCLGSIDMFFYEKILKVLEVVVIYSE